MAAYPRIETPAFPPQGAGEPPADYGMRALLFVLAHGDVSTWRLDDASVEAAHWAANAALTARGIADQTISALRGCQDHLRAILAGRQADARAAAAAGAQPVAAVPEVAPVAPAAGGGGGQRVPVAPRPKRQPPTGGAGVPQPMPGALVAPVRPVAAVPVADDLF